MNDPGWFDYLLLLFLGMLVLDAISKAWSWVTGRHPDRDERIRATALALAIESHGPMVGEEHDACFPARARVFERYLRTGHHREGHRSDEAPRPVSEVRR